MLDLFVIALMMSLINRDQIIVFTMGPAAFYFGAAVILTILAVEWLDSQLIWDDLPQESPTTPIEAQIKHKYRISPFWLLPFIALLIAGSLVYNNWQQRGVEITIDFQSAAGIVAGRTPIRYQGVDVGGYNRSI